MLDALPQIPLFEDLNGDQVSLLRSLFEPVNYPSGAIIIAQGAVALHLYLTLKGIVAIHYKPYDGPSLILTRLRAALLDGEIASREDEERLVRDMLDRGSNE